MRGRDALATQKITHSERKRRISKSGTALEIEILRFAQDDIGCRDCAVDYIAVEIGRVDPPVVAWLGSPPIS